VRFRNILLTAGIVAVPLIARAQPVTGLYISTGAGVNIMQNETVASVNGIATPGRHLSLNPGATALASIGWGFANGLRAELEFDYRYNGLNKVSGPPEMREMRYRPVRGGELNSHSSRIVCVPWL
jgi:OOP family OmpA-OmpF porin